MGLFGSLARGAATLSRTPVLGSVLKAVPGVGLALTAADVGMSVYNMAGTGTKGGVPNLQQLGALPPLPPMANRMTLGQGAGRTVPSGSTVPAVRQQHQQQIAMYGGRGRHRIPPVQAIEMLISAGVTLGSNYWRTKVCAPPGYVMVTHPISGGKLAVPKSMAINAGLWSPHKKPPISVRQWHALKNAKSAIKQLRRVEKAAHIVQHATTHRKSPVHAIAYKKRK